MKKVVKKGGKHAKKKAKKEEKKAHKLSKELVKSQQAMAALKSKTRRTHALRRRRSAGVASIRKIRPSCRSANRSPRRLRKLLVNLNHRRLSHLGGPRPHPHLLPLMHLQRHRSAYT